MKKLLAGLTVFYGLGIILADLLRVGFWLCLGLALVIWIFIFCRPQRERLFLAAVFFLALLAGAANLQNSYRLSGCHIRNLVLSNKKSLTYAVNGFVCSLPEFKHGYYWFVVQAQKIQVDKIKYPCCGKLLVKSDFVQALNYGDNLKLIGPLLCLPGFYRNAGGYRGFLARENIYLIMAITDPRQINRLNIVSGVRFFRAGMRLRVYLEQVINRQLPALPASILSAMVLGEKRGIPWLVNNNMVRTGTVHILVVSGFNVGIVGWLVNLLLKILRVGPKARIILVAVALLFYCLVTGASNPVIRATVMGLFLCLAYFLEREPDIYNSISCAALFILLGNPRQIFDIGFQLSFSSVLAIIYLYPRLKSLFGRKFPSNKILNLIAEGSLVSLSAWIGTLVIIALNFRMVSPVTVLANIVIVPLATLITLCGFTLVLSGVVLPGLGQLFSLPTALLINWLLTINAVLAKLPLAYIVF